MISDSGRSGTDDDVDDVIPESILSLSKDARYIRQCQILLQQALTALLERKEALVASGPGGPEGQRELQRIRKQTTWLISCILYILVSITTGRTLGMEAVGLTFSNNNDNDNISTTSKTQLVTRTNNTRLCRSLFVGVSLLLTATGGLLWEYFTTASSERANSNSFDGECDGDNQQQQQERLRGRERRLIHERLRRQMLERANIITPTPTTTTTTTTIGDNLSAGNTDSDGISTTPVNNNSNQQVQQRSEQGRETEHADAITTRRSKTPSASQRLLSISRRLSKFIFKVYSNSDGPHDIVQTSIDDDNDDGNNENNTSASYSIALWLVRLHLAQYLLTGKYPTLMHRFLGLEPRREKIDGITTTKKSSTIISRPNTNRAIAFIILLQASTSLVQNTANWFARNAANYLEARASTRRNGDNQNSDAQFSKAQLQKKLDNFFSNRSSEIMEEQSGIGAKLSIRNNSRNNNNNKMACTICRLDRIHPAAPSSCGHVCCWNCLIQWVSTVRPECPLCRSPCSAKDVIALHNYEPAV